MRSIANLNIRTLATVPPDATAAGKRVALSANETILRLAGSFESEAVLSPAVSIGQMLINFDREHGRAPEPWADTLPPMEALSSRYIFSV